MAEESRFAKIATVTVTGSAANTITFAEFQTGVGLQVGATRGKGLAMLIDEIDYYVTNLNLVLALDGDIVRYGITTSNQVSAVEDLADRRILHSAERQLRAITAASVVTFTQPHIHQFFPALLWAEPTLFLATDGESQPVVPTVVARIFYRLIELDQSLIFEVAQQFRIVS